MAALVGVGCVELDASQRMFAVHRPEADNSCGTSVLRGRARRIRGRPVGSTMCRQANHDRSAEISRFTEFVDRELPSCTGRKRVTTAVYGNTVIGDRPQTRRKRQ